MFGFGKKKSVDKNSRDSAAIKTFGENDKIGIMCDEIQIRIGENEYCYRTSDVVKISILTTDQGPFVDDVALLIAMKDCSFILPSEHPLYEKFLFDDMSGKIPIDFHKIIEASSCAENAEFVLYTK